MNQLPTDLVQAIAGFVHRKDILSFRLTCRSFAALGLPRQFEVIPVSSFRHSLENLRHISENPVYRNYVHTIEYGPGIVVKFRSRLEWISSIREYPPPGDYDEPFSVGELEQACMCPDLMLHPHAYTD